MLLRQCRSHTRAVRNPEVVPKGAKCLIGVGRVPECAERKKKPDTDLSAFCITHRVTPEADLLTYGTASGFPNPKDEDSQSECHESY
jgi:hypothetical protein